MTLTRLSLTHRGRTHGWHVVISVGVVVYVGIIGVIIVVSTAAYRHQSGLLILSVLFLLFCFGLVV